jgi:hypothetical protein
MEVAEKLAGSNSFGPLASLRVTTSAYRFPVLPALPPYRTLVMLLIATGGVSLWSRARAV